MLFFSPRLLERKRASDTSRKPDFFGIGLPYMPCVAPFMAGEIEKAMKFMKHYSGTRLLGNHVPYPVEAWPEGGQRHLFCRKRTLWTYYHRRHFRYSSHRTPFFHPDSSPTTRMGIYVPFGKSKTFDSDFDIEVIRKPNRQTTSNSKKEGNTILNKQVKNGTTIKCKI